MDFSKLSFKDGVFFAWWSESRWCRVGILSRRQSQRTEQKKKWHQKQGMSGTTGCGGGMTTYYSMMTWTDRYFAPLWCVVCHAVIASFAVDRRHSKYTHQTIRRQIFNVNGWRKFDDGEIENKVLRFFFLSLLPTHVFWTRNSGLQFHF